MQQEIRFATFNVCNLARPGVAFYANLPAYGEAEYADKLDWIARQLDVLDADVIAFQEIFSQAALKDVLARTRKYQNAHHLGLDPDPAISPLTPSVALVSRLPLAGAAVSHTDLAPELVTRLPQTDLPTTRFTRPVLQVPLRLPNDVVVNVFVVHLKSKRPDFHAGEDELDADLFGLASLRSLCRRGAEALGLRYLLNRYMPAGRHDPVVVMGDFNDIAEAVTTQLVMGAGRYGEAEFAEHSHRLFDCYRIQPQGHGARDVGYSHVHDGWFNTIDHVLVSKEFHPDYFDAVGRVEQVIYMNDHVAHRQLSASDHGIVLVRVSLSANAPAADAALSLPG